MCLFTIHGSHTVLQGFLGDRSGSLRKLDLKLLSRFLSGKAHGAIRLLGWGQDGTWWTTRVIHSEECWLCVKAFARQQGICLPITQTANSASWWEDGASPQRRRAWPLMVSPWQHCYLHHCIPTRGHVHLEELWGSELPVRPTSLLKTRWREWVTPLG